MTTIPAWAIVGVGEVGILIGAGSVNAVRRRMGRGTLTPLARLGGGYVFDARDHGATGPDDPRIASRKLLTDPDRLVDVDELATIGRMAAAHGVSRPAFVNWINRGKIEVDPICEIGFTVYAGER